MKISSYLSDTLARDEEILVVAKLHKIVYIVPVFFIFLGLIALIAGIELAQAYVIFALLDFVGVMFIFIGAFDIWHKTNREMIATNKRIIDKRGIFSIKTAELRNDKIEAVAVNQTLWGRILGFGNVLFSGTGTTRVLFQDIADPVNVKVACEEIIATSHSHA